MIDLVSQYCQENKLTINCKKTKCITFNKTGRIIRQNFSLNGVLLENVRQYKYLGFIFTPSGEIGTGMKDLRDRALKSYHALKNKMGDSFNRDIMITLSLFDSLIKPILLYSSDFWGCLKLPKNNPIETLHMKICKQILGVHKQTTNIGVLLELGRTSLDLEGIKLGVKNWERIRKRNANKLVLASYTDAKEENLPWITGIKDKLEKNGMLSLFINEYPEAPNFIHRKLLKTLIDEFHQNAFAGIRQEGSKLRTYALFKTEIGMEKYLIEIKNITIRTQVTKFRLSDHNLMIEKGRHNGVKAHLRFCPFCENEVESEIHFLLDCPVYRNIRNHLINLIERENHFFRYLQKEEKFSYLLANVNQKEIAEYIHNTFELRNFLTMLPKRVE